MTNRTRTSMALLLVGGRGDCRTSTGEYVKKAGHLATTLAAIVTIGACGGGSGSPTSPTALAPPSLTPAPTSSPSGRITAVSIEPDSGTTMTVRDCDLAGGAKRTGVCAEQFRGLFEVVVDRYVRDPVLTVGFYDGSELCGYAAWSVDAIVPGETLSFSLSVIYLSWEKWDATGSRGIVQPCALPLTTTRMVAEVWSDGDGFSLKQEFANSYTFQRP